MLVEIRQETTCYYSSPRHQGSIWGRFFYIHEGRGILQANSEGLKLIRDSGTLKLPFKNIKSVGLGLFSRFAKPAGLMYLDLKYTTEDGDFAEIHLVPFKSMFDPTWATSQMVQSWYETLRDQEELQGRIEPPTFDPPRNSPEKKRLFQILILGIPLLLLTAALFGLLLLRR